MKQNLLFSLFFFLLICFGIFYYFFYHSPTKEISEKNKDTQKEEIQWQTRLEHADMLSYLHQYPEAEEEYRKLIDLNPLSIIAKVNLAKILYYQGKSDQALDLLKEIPYQQKENKILLLMADIHLELKHYDEAERFYSQYLNEFPDDSHALLQLAKLYSWKKKYEDSIGLYKKLLSHEPTNLQIRRQYALVLIWKGKYQEGMEELKKTLEQENYPLPNQEKK